MKAAYDPRTCQWAFVISERAIASNYRWARTVEEWVALARQQATDTPEQPPVIEGEVINVDQLPAARL